MSQESSQKIAFIGIGTMGSALARVLVQAKNDVIIWNRTATKPQVDALIEIGATFEDNIAVVVSKSDVIMFSVINYNAIYQILAPLQNSPSSFAGKTIVNYTNGTSQEVRDLEVWMKHNGAAQYFDSAIMVMPDFVGKPDAFIMYSGETEQRFEAIIPLLQQLGGTFYEGTDVGRAAGLDMAALASMYGMWSGALVGMSLLEKLAQRVPEKKQSITMDVEKTVLPLLKFLIPFVSAMAKSVDEKTWGDPMGTPVGMQLLAVRNIQKACHEEGVDSSYLDMIARVMQQVADERGTHGGIAQTTQYLQH